MSRAKSRNLNIGIVGATGAVGRRMVLEICHKFPQSRLALFASSRSAGKNIVVNDRSFVVQKFSLEALTELDYVLMSAGGSFSREWAERIAGSGVTVIDNSSAWRSDDRFPLIIPGVNDFTLSSYPEAKIFPVANCSTIQLVMCLAPLHKAFRLDSVNVCTYQSVSGAGTDAMDELNAQWGALLQGSYSSPIVLPRVIASELIPAIDVIGSDGHCFEELKMVNETRKIFSLPELEILASTVRVPTLQGHGEAVTVRLKESVTQAEVLGALSKASLLVVDETNDYSGLAQLADVIGQEVVRVSRVRLPSGCKHSKTIQLWNAADNLGLGAATTAINLLGMLEGENL